ncbi:MAG: hypothetical protein GY756_05225 [bacterium]|nr:hypothetical protein [bacterium]
MKTNYKIKLCISLIVFGVSISGNLFAEERTGREFNELIKEMNNELNTARQKVETIEEKRLEKKSANPVKVLPERKQALKDLESLKTKMDKSKTPNEKKLIAQKMETKILKISELSTDFIGSMKNDLVSQDQQLEVIEETLSDVILKMDKLRKLVKGNLKGTSPELARFKARKSLQNLAQMVEVLADKQKNTQQWSHVRKTIMLQDKILRRGTLATDTIQKMLNNQQNVYEQVLAQVTIARQALQSEKEILAQVALGEIAKSMLRKAAGLLVGNSTITQIGESAFIQSEKRQQQIMNFLEQDQEEGVYTGVALNNGSNISGSIQPDGYSDYLNETISKN